MCQLLHGFHVESEESNEKSMMRWRITVYFTLLFEIDISVLGVQIVVLWLAVLCSLP